MKPPTNERSENVRGFVWCERKLRVPQEGVREKNSVGGGKITYQSMVTIGTTMSIKSISQSSEHKGKGDVRKGEGKNEGEQ